MFSSLLQQRSKTVSNLLSNLSFVRSMGGGPRTFPGGLNKWQWKRLHEKKAKEKERKLLDQEKQLYQARIRSQIRVKLSGRSEENQSLSSSDHNNPMSAKDHIKALADRFMKEGAEDLWNEDDGPITTGPPPRNRAVEAPKDMRKVIPDGRNLAENRGNLNSRSHFDSMRPRYYSVQAGRKSPQDRRRSPQRFRLKRNESSSSDEDSEISSEEELLRPSGRSSRFNFHEEELERPSGKKLLGRAVLGNFDPKKTRIKPKVVEEECGLSQQVDYIRNELKKRNEYREEVRQQREESHLSNKRFDECNISQLTIKALTSAGYLQMTRVQDATLTAYLDGMDALVKAKTGTGKSAAFLLPAIEAVLKGPRNSRNPRVPPIISLILCPTRELASQIAAEATVILKCHDGIGVQTLIGGTRFKLDQQRLESDLCQILVATPGRLLDHIENTSGFSVRLMGLKMLVLDEADHLLDLGFRKDLEKIIDCVPRQRQSLLFSATIPKEVRRVSQLVLKRDHVFIDTVGLGSVETPVKVKQLYYIAPHELHFQIVPQLLKEHISEVVDYKVIVFCTSAMVTSLMFLLLRELKMNAREMHSRKPQLYRTRVCDEFKESKRLILVTSDVSARGMNYPDVTLVVQVGIPTDREQYIHRLGRTGREGKAGTGVLLLAPWEAYFLDEIKDLPMEKSSSVQLDPDTKHKVEDAMMKIDTSVKEAAYHAWLGFYNSIREIGRDKTTLVDLANRFCDSIGLQRPPALFRKTALKMGLKDIPGIRIRK